MKIGVLGASDIAKRRMIPAILKSKFFEYAGVAVATAEERIVIHSEKKMDAILESKINKAEKFVELFGGKYYTGYEDLLNERDIEAVYIPLPPALHYYWAKKAIENGKHVLLEKPFTTKFSDAEDLVKIAAEKKVVVLENYGFCFHNQMKKIKTIYESGAIGELRLIRAYFGFPHRDPNDFRYSKKMGGGALLDCGGYVVKAALLFMGNKIKVVGSALNSPKGYEVDLFGNAMLQDENNLIAQLSFGMDNSYKCEFELWGSKGSVISPRAYTAPETISIPLSINSSEGNKIVEVEPDDQFLRILDKFYFEIQNGNESVCEILGQSNILETIARLSN